ncbi:MAG TPA: helicase HerA-like domain-containing protein [Bryobacteraceae bacterium]|nr:helicase HerA-like domain-containing protein [Bryobacteraceae bacterium]
MSLLLAKDLKIPLEAVTQTFAILGIKGSGKTNTGVVLAEELLKHKQQVVVLDPVDVWWGLKSSKDGRAPGFSIPVIGGDHGDIPLEATSGSLLADFVTDTGASAILVLRHLSMNDQRRFAGDFAKRLYERKGRQRSPLMLIIDEADEFVPQRLAHGHEAMFGAFDRIVRRGRTSGIGVTLITQRPQVINKDVLTQVEVLVGMRVLHKLDRKALEAWIEAHDTEGRREDFLESLASLGLGEAWVWSPSWLNVFERVRIRARETYDSSATPKAGAQLAAPREVAPVDLDALRAKMATSLERAKADDPRELRKRFVQLESELRKKTSAAVDPEALARARAEGERTAEQRLKPNIERYQKAVANALRVLQSLNGFAAAPAAPVPTPDVKVASTPTAPSASRHALGTPRVQTPLDSSAKLSSGERKILTALAQYPDGKTDSQVAGCEVAPVIRVEYLRNAANLPPAILFSPDRLAQSKGSVQG